MARFNILRSSASILFGGVLVSIIAGIFHPDREPANNHSAVFAEYAGSDIWTLVHLGQFLGMLGMITGLLLLSVALQQRGALTVWLGHLARVSAIVSLALYGVLQAVDGIALKQAVNAWAAAPEAEKFVRFSSAETIRWLEWGTRSYQSFMFGLSLILFGVAIASAAQISRNIGYLMGLSGLTYLVQGWVIGTEGFSMHNHVPTLLGVALIVAWSISLLFAAWRDPKAS